MTLRLKLNSMSVTNAPGSDSPSGDDDFETSPMGLYDTPKSVTMELELTRIGQQHPRIEEAVRAFWGHSGCIDFLQQLIQSGGEGVGSRRVSFQPEVAAALRNLLRLHDGSQ